jgi:hypothetical protein
MHVNWNYTMMGKSIRFVYCWPFYWKNNQYCHCLLLRFIHNKKQRYEFSLQKTAVLLYMFCCASYFFYYKTQRRAVKFHGYSV